MGGEDADARLRPVQGMDEGNLDEARHEHGDGDGAGHGLLIKGHEAAASGNGLHAVAFELPGRFHKHGLKLVRGGGKDFARPYARQDAADDRKIEGKRVPELPRRFGKMRVQTQDAHRGVVVEIAAAQAHDACSPFARRFSKRGRFIII